ncbi:hypothetical protein DFP72DRAFT_853904 [Ephemerocybe angulata]|uniref:Uncharacterized protein n=1 Tax=Ephemerocybe angulata TaxID=980116 RepID=A0A8H6HLQ6_9AGAR|nr:hypothetical protein DFP72DRAFT_853904 [Tulosesus angulatus]
MTMSRTTSLSSSSVHHLLDGAAGVDGNWVCDCGKVSLALFNLAMGITVINIEADNFPVEFMIIWGIRKVDKDIFPNLLSMTQAYWRKVSEKEPGIIQVKVVRATHQHAISRVMPGTGFSKLCGRIHPWFRRLDHYLQVHIRDSNLQTDGFT